jgi:hypothetical protein
MKQPNHTAVILRELRQRLAHNESYLTQSTESRVKIQQFAAPEEPCNRDWVEGEASAIRDENDWLRWVLNEYSPLKGQIKALEK